MRYKKHLVQVRTRQATKRLYSSLDEIGIVICISVAAASRAEASRRQATHRVARRQAAHRVARLGPGRSTLFRYTLSGDKLFYIVRQYLMLRAVDKLF
ncbi:hypothetical protein BHM03_00011473 [Ensete ventricosum]|nr:hypothetical protein BHM03_00011473 [Ensete ventricosum]